MPYTFKSFKQPRFWYQFLSVFWMGSVWVTGLCVVPTLFLVLEKSYAVEVASLVFRLLGVIMFLVISVLLLTSLKVNIHRKQLWLLIIAFLCAIILYTVIVPQLLANQHASVKNPIWHNLATAFFVLQMLFSGLCVWWARVYKH